jgi:5-methyltetrahydrofolate--homocysteine methyltransferase
LDDAEKGVEARNLFADAEAMLQQLIAENWLRARAVIGLFPANSSGDDIEVYRDEERKQLLTTLHNLRKQGRQPRGKYNECLADFVAPKGSGKADYIGGFACTAGQGIDAKLAEFAAEHDDYQSIMLKALADRLAEALAEMLHRKVRTELWGYAAAEQLDNRALIDERYSGIRPATGYPASPDHTEKDLLWELLKVEENTGIRLTESKAMVPTASVSGLYLAHPQARYFAVGKIDKAQVADYAGRKGMSLEEVERWLAPNLAYEP